MCQPIGKQYWKKIPEELEDILEDTKHYVDLIAMGEEDDYYVKLSNGKEYWNIPQKLADRCFNQIINDKLTFYW